MKALSVLLPLDSGGRHTVLGSGSPFRPTLVSENKLTGPLSPSSPNSRWSRDGSGSPEQAEGQAQAGKGLGVTGRPGNPSVRISSPASSTSGRYSPERFQACLTPHFRQEAVRLLMFLGSQGTRSFRPRLHRALMAGEILSLGDRSWVSAFHVLCRINTAETRLILRHNPAKELAVPSGHSGPGSDNTSSSPVFHWTRAFPVLCHPE